MIWAIAIGVVVLILLAFLFGCFKQERRQADMDQEKETAE